MAKPLPSWLWASGGFNCRRPSITFCCSKGCWTVRTPAIPPMPQERWPRFMKTADSMIAPLNTGPLTKTTTDLLPATILIRSSITGGSLSPAVPSLRAKIRRWNIAFETASAWRLQLTACGSAGCWKMSKPISDPGQGDWSGKR